MITGLSVLGSPDLGSADRAQRHRTITEAVRMLTKGDS